MRLVPSGNGQTRPGLVDWSRFCPSTETSYPLARMMGGLFSFQRSTFVVNLWPMNTVTLHAEIAQPAPHFKSPTAWMLYVYLLSLSDDKGKALIGRKSASKALLVSQNTIRRTLKSLYDDSWITLGNPNVSISPPRGAATPPTVVTICNYETYKQSVSKSTTGGGPPNMAIKLQTPQVHKTSENPHICISDISDQRREEKKDTTLIPKGSDGKEKITAKTPPLADKRVTWLTPFWDAWKERVGGEPSGGQLAKCLKPLIEADGQDCVIAGWKKYLEKTEPQFASPSRFSQTYGHWVKNAPKHNPNAVWVNDKDLEKVLKEMREKSNSDKHHISHPSSKPPDCAASVPELQGCGDSVPC